MSRSLPNAAWYMGYGGLLPFLGLTVALLLNVDSLPFASRVSVAGWLLIYAATILSFIGAVHWGVALGMANTLSNDRKGWLMGYSVVPALLAWIMLLLPNAIALFAMAVCIALAYLADRLWLFPLLQSDYAHLRLHLTVVVASSLLVAGWAV